MELTLANLIRFTGAAQLCVLIASSLVPLRLNWKRDLAALPVLHRQMYWTYGGYVVLGIVFLGGASLACAEELASGARLGRVVCLYGFVFWGARLPLQAVFDAKPFLTARWLRAGYHLLTVLFLTFIGVYGYALLR